MGNIQGIIKTPSAVGINGATINFYTGSTGTISYTATADSSGIYTQSVAATWFGTSVVTASGYESCWCEGTDFWNEIKTFTATGAERTQDWYGKKAFTSGSGTQVNPWVITDLDSMWNVRYATGSGDFYILGNNIDLSGISWKPIPLAYGNTSRFRGGFDGRGYSISNYTMETPQETGWPDSSGDESYYGLFGYMSPSSSVITGNVTFISCSIIHHDHWTVSSNALKVFGIFAGYHWADTFNKTPVENVHVKGCTNTYDRSGSHAIITYRGGIFGYQRTPAVGEARMYSCSVEGSTIINVMPLGFGNTNNVGGLLGYDGGATQFIYYCYVKDSTIFQNWVNNDGPTCGLSCGSNNYLRNNYVLNCIVSGAGRVAPIGNSTNASSYGNWSAGIDYGTTLEADRRAFTSQNSNTNGFNYYEITSQSSTITVSGSGVVAATTAELKNPLWYEGMNFSTVWDHQNISARNDVAAVDYAPDSNQKFQYNYRMLITGSSITETVKTIKIKFASATGSECVFKGASIMERVGTGYTGTNLVRIVQNNGNIITVPQGEDVYSDVLVYTLTPGQDYFIHLYNNIAYNAGYKDHGHLMCYYRASSTDYSQNVAYTTNTPVNYTIGLDSVVNIQIVTGSA